jgi:AP-1 complex subunit sigma 1/2
MDGSVGVETWGPRQIETVLLMSRQGKTRLSKWYVAATATQKTRMIREITALVLSRPAKQCNFIEFKDKKIVYKRCVLILFSPPFHCRPFDLVVGYSYASLYFIACISKDENELITLEKIHLYVEVLDRYFGNVRSIRRVCCIGEVACTDALL